MLASENAPEPRSHDVDISKPGASEQQGFGWLATIGLALLAIIGFGILGADGCLYVFGLLVLGFLAWIAWQLFVRGGLFTWGRLARAPAKALARGNSAEAERAFEKALKRARRFSSHDYRRGLMLIDLAQYAKDQGRYSQAKTFFEECVEIPVACWQPVRMSYFVLLNNYAVYYMNVRDYAAAQRIWENVLEMTPILKKENANSQWFDFVLHVNLAVLFLELQEFAEAADHLHEAQRLFPDLLKAHQAMVVDWYYSIRANHMSAMGQFENASAEIARVKNQDSLICVGARAKLHLGKQEYSQAEQLLRRLLDQQCKIGSVHRPDLLLCKLEFAKSLFGQGKHDEAFLVVGEARRIVVDFAMPANKIWRNTLLAWLHHAKELGRIDDMATLEADLQSMAPVSDHAITISAKLRVQSDNEFRGPAEE